MIGLSRLSATKAAAITALPPLHRLTQLTLSRFYSGAASTAQPQLDYSSSDYYYYDYNNHKSKAPSAKKHVFAERLSKLLEVPHISIATLVRQDLSPRSSLYKQIANAVNCGELVPEDIIFGLLSKRLEDGYYQGENGFILDGIPRSPIQAEILDQLAEIDLVVNFKCSEDGLLKHREEANWKEKIQLYVEQVVFNSHFSVLPCIPVDAS
uniref:adenylate kinase n=1 Tax=Fagus sylvatica TaxID=28930 RepID=A0A2N9HXS7_FAGSY